MSGESSFRIVFEQDDYPRELIGPNDWSKAILSEELRPDTQVTLYRHGEAPVVQCAQDVPELAALFRQVQNDGVNSPATDAPHSEASKAPEPLKKVTPPEPSNALEPRSIDQNQPAAFGNDLRARPVTAGGGKTRYKALDGRSFATAPEARRHSDGVMAQRNRAASIAVGDKARAEARKPRARNSPNAKKDDKLFGWVLLGILFLAWALS